MEIRRSGLTVRSGGERLAARLGSSVRHQRVIMAIQRHATHVHWNFFLALEEDVERLARFVDLSGNNATYSIEIARLLLGACAETDVVLKQLVCRLEPGCRAEKLGGYFVPLVTRLPNFRKFEATIPRFGVKLRPWSGWRQDRAPLWWSAHNKVKHERHDHFIQANLKNCLNAVAGLYAATLHLYAEDAEQALLNGQPRLFGCSPPHNAGSVLAGQGVVLRYQGLRA